MATLAAAEGATIHRVKALGVARQHVPVLAAVGAGGLRAHIELTHTTMSPEDVHAQQLW